MKRFAATLLATLGILVGTAIAQTVPTQGLPARFIAAFPGAGVETTALLGAYVKSITPAGVATVQLDDESETTVTLTASGGGATITSGISDPTGGNAGDAYLQVDASDVIQSIWLNVSGTWGEFTIPTAGTSTDDQTAAEVNTDTTNFGNNLSGTDTTVQAALDTLDNLNVGGGGTDDQTAAEVPVTATGFDGNLATTDTNVQLVAQALDDLVIPAASTDDQTAVEVSTSTTNFDGILDTADTTVQAALDSLDDITPARTLQSGTPSDIAATSVTGTAVQVSREDHAHGGFTGPATRDLLNGLTGVNRLSGAAIRDVTAAQTSTNVVNFDGHLSNTDTTVQAALDTLDGITVSGDQIELIDSLNDVGYTQADTADLSGRFGSGATVYTADIDAEGDADAEINDLLVFQWRDNPSGVPDDRQLGIRVNDTGTTLPIRIVNPLNNTLTNKTVADLTRYEFLFLSRQDGVFIQMSSLALSAVMERILPDSPTDDQIARYDAGTSAWVAEDLPAGGAGTFTGLTDTPTAYTNAARHLLRVNGTPDGVEFIPEPANDNTIPHVSRLPAVADDSPVLVFLTHDENDGAREDATLTVGEALGQYCGYSNGDIFQAFGSINKPSPIEMIFGIWDGTDCTITTVHSANEGFIDDIRSVIFTVTGGTEMTCQLGAAFQEYGYQTKRITSCTGLEDIGTVDVTINFLYADGTTAYWTDGSQRHRAGLYEKTGTPAVYHDLAPPEDAHRTGEGSAACGDSNPPDAAGQLCVTTDGRGYFAMPRTSLVTTPATISVGASGSGLFIPDIYTASQLENRNNLSDGDFLYIKATQEFYQFQDPDFEVVTWMEAWQYAIDNVGDTPARQTFLTSIFLGEFASENEVILDRDGHTTPLPAQATATVTAGVVTAIEITYGGSGYMAAPTITIEAPGTGTTATATATITDGVVTAITITDGGSGYAAAPDVTFSDPSGFIEYYFLYSDFGALIHITEFTNSIRETISEGFAWRGPVIIPEEVLDIVEANPVDEIDEPLDSVLIGSQRYSVIVRPGSNGALRNPIAADYDATYARSKVVAVVDGKPYKVRRTLVDGHTATGTFTEVAVNTRLAAGGSGTFRFRGVYTADQHVNNPETEDIYYNIQYHHWRLRDYDDYYGNYWVTLPNGGEILNRLSWVNYYPSEDEALAHATAMGQRFVFPDDSDTWHLYTLTAFTAAESAHYGYSWTESVPLPESEGNVTLIDDQSLDWASADKPSVEVEISRPLVEADDGRAVLIDYRPNAASDESRAAGGVILAEHLRHLTTLRPVSLLKVGPGFGGRSAIDRTMDVTGSPGSVEFPFPLSSGDNALHWMRLHYIGDHIDDVDGAFLFTATTLTLNSVADIRTDTNYWIVGPVSGAGCEVTNHSEKVTVTAIGDPNPDDITVVRGVDGTAIGDANCLQFVSGADFILDDKTTFTMVPTHDDQDSGDFTFTLLAEGVGGGGGDPVEVGGFQTSEVGSIAAAITTNTAGTWTGTGITLPAHVAGVDRWVVTHANNGEWHWHRTSDYGSVTAGVIGEAVAAAQIWDTYLEFFSGLLRTAEFGISATRELLVAVRNVNNNTYVNATFDTLEARVVD